VSGPRRVASLACIPAMLLVSMSSRSATVSVGDLARCAAIAGPDLRLACYDALAGRPPDQSAPSVAAPPAVAAPPSVAAAPAVAPPPAAAAPSAAARNDPANFGLTPAQIRPVAPPGPSAVQAHVAQIIQSATGFGHPIVVLDNGQTWIFTEAADDSRLGGGDPVTIKRAALGSFMMSTPSHHTYHVHRLQ